MTKLTQEQLILSELKKAGSMVDIPSMFNLYLQSDYKLKNIALAINKTSAYLSKHFREHAIETKQLEHYEKIAKQKSKTMLGKLPWNTGIHLPKYMRDKLRDYRLKHPTRYWLNKKRPCVQKEKHHSWRGGITRAGKYWKIANSMMDQAVIPLLDLKNGAAAPYHRYQWVKAHMRKIPNGFDVHHIDGNRDNNNPENLHLIDESTHARLHNSLRRKK